MKIEELPLYLNEGQVAQLLGISTSALQKHRHQRKGLPFCKHGRSVRYRRDEVIAYMDQHRVDGASHV